jgi:hypothetical protein
MRKRAEKAGAAKVKVQRGNGNFLGKRVYDSGRLCTSAVIKLTDSDPAGASKLIYRHGPREHLFQDCLPIIICD